MILMLLPADHPGKSMSSWITAEMSVVFSSSCSVLHARGLQSTAHMMPQHLKKKMHNYKLGWRCLPDSEVLAILEIMPRGQPPTQLGSLL